ncbi:hypothetical protein ACU635_24520 [[Actinomadura] parvosata]|uniref:hypothetical protein n=1 Tax=[Actinomadura] parvosata TaxID=1955412 RepID=UPI00406C2E3D
MRDAQPSQTALMAAAARAPHLVVDGDHVILSGTRAQVTARAAYTERLLGDVEYAAFATADRGEPWLSLFTPDELSALLKRHGLEVVEHVRQAGCVDPGLWRREDGLRPADLCRLVRATVTP